MMLRPVNFMDQFAMGDPEWVWLLVYYSLIILLTTQTSLKFKILHSLSWESVTELISCPVGVITMEV